MPLSACNDDGVHPLPGKRRPRPAQAVAPGGLRDNPSPAPDASASDGNRGGDRYRHGEAISAAFVESAVNQVISKRYVKKQQMRWTERGAHLLLQVRTKLMNEDWSGTVRRWHPAMAAEPEARAA